MIIYSKYYLIFLVIIFLILNEKCTKASTRNVGDEQADSIVLAVDKVSNYKLNNPHAKINCYWANNFDDKGGFGYENSKFFFNCLECYCSNDKIDVKMICYPSKLQFPDCKTSPEDFWIKKRDGVSDYKHKYFFDTINNWASEGTEVKGLVYQGEKQVVGETRQEPDAGFENNKMVTGIDATISNTAGETLREPDGGLENSKMVTEIDTIDLDTDGKPFKCHAEMKIPEDESINFICYSCTCQRIAGFNIKISCSAYDQHDNPDCYDKLVKWEEEIKKNEVKAGR